MLLDLVSIAEKLGASDIHVTTNRYATYRVKGKLIPNNNGKLYSENDIKEIFIGLKLNMQRLEDTDHYDVGASVGDSRLRIHFYNTLDGLAISIRLIPQKIPNFDDLFLPEVIKSFAHKRTGLVIVTGATGSGKSTTLASLIEYINKNMNKKIVTVEDPIEYIYKDNQSLIVQREIGTHVTKFDDAIVQAMREDPDILLVGELRDLDTIQSALRMAETGHLVFGTLHTRGAAESFSRMIDVFPGNQQDQIRVQLSTVTQGVISQQLITTEKGLRIPLCEVLVMNSGARGVINSPNGNLSALKDNIQQNNQKLGSQTFVQSASSLISQKLVSLDDLKDIFDDEEMKKLRTTLTGRY
jgi:twitching motility protein PilT